MFARLCHFALSLVLLKKPRLGGVLLRCGRLHLDFDDRHLDEIVNGDETDEPVSLHHGNVAAGASSFLTSAG